MAATMDRAALLSLAAPALTHTPAWLATGGPQGAAAAVQSTFVSPVLRGAAWLHESGGVVRLVTIDPRDVVMQVQRAANAALRRRAERAIAEDGAWGTETRRGIRALAEESLGAVVPPNALNLSLLEWALAATFHNGDGLVVIPRSVELPALDRPQRVAPAPSGHLQIDVIAQGGRLVTPSPSTPMAPVCDPRLVLSAVPPGTAAASWASMNDADRLAAWRAYASANPAASIPGCPPGATLATVSEPPPSPPVAASLAPGQMFGVVLGLVGLAYVSHVVVRELRNPTPPPRSRPQRPRATRRPKRSR